MTGFLRQLPGLLLALLCTIGISPAATAAGNKDWSPAKAEQIQRQTQRATSREKALSGAQQQAAAEALMRAETGFGDTHPPRQIDGITPDPRETARIVALSKRLQAQRKNPAFSAATQTAAAHKLGAATTNIVISAGAQGQPDSGYLFAYESGCGYLGYAWIQADGSAVVPAAAGTTVDLAFMLDQPFAAQGLSNHTLVEGATINLNAAQRVPINVQVDGGGSYAGALGLEISFQLRGLNFDRQFNAEQGGGSPYGVYLAPATDYQFRAFPAVPYLTTHAPAIVNSSGPIDITVQAGHTVTGSIDDPQNLMASCNANLDVASYGIQLRDDTDGELLGTGVVTEAGGDPASFVVAVPHNVPVRIKGEFSGDCSIQDWELERAVFSSDDSVNLSLLPRPNPLFNVRTPTATPLNWDYGYADEVDRPFISHYFSPGNPPSLQAGKDYWFHVDTLDDTTPAVARVTAQAGDFAVDLVAEPVATLNVHLNPGSDAYSVGVIKAYRDGQLQAAIEIDSDADYVLKVAPGNYDLIVSGLAGWRTNTATNQTNAVFLKPIIYTRSLVVGTQSLDIVLPRPATGITWDMSSAEVRTHVTAIQGLEPVGAYAMPWYYEGIYTDLSPLKLRLRGAGLDDVEVSFPIANPRPTVDYAGLLSTSGRYTGTLRDAEGNVLADSPIQLYGGNNGYLWTRYTDGSGVFDLPKVRDATYLIFAPATGTSLSRQLRMGNPAGNTVGDIQLDGATFIAANPAGPSLQRIHGSGDQAFRIVFVAEGYTTASESFTDSNSNGVWDGLLYLDLNQNNVWNNGEPVTPYGAASYPGAGQNGTDVTLGNEAFVDSNGDGYPNINDFALFEQNARSYVRALLGVPEIRDNMDFDAYLLFLPSNQAGMDVYDADDNLLLARDTRFGATYETGRHLLSADYSEVRNVIRSQLERWDLQVLLIHQPVRAGRANSFILANGGIGAVSPNSLVAGHEFGHNPGGLYDEYNEFNGTNLDFVSIRGGHVTHSPDPSAAPWSDLIGSRLDTPIAIPQSNGTGMYAGALYQAGGAYRPSDDSRMRHNAPRYNAPSERWLAFTLCAAGLDPSAVGTPPDDDPLQIFRAGFEDPVPASVLPCPK